MSILETDVIDIISVDKDTGKIELAMTDHLEWDEENKHLLLLQSKLNVYLSFLKSGKIYEGHEDFKGRQFAINVVFMNAPTPNAVQFLEKVRPIVGKYGYELKYMTFKAK